MYEGPKDRDMDYQYLFPLYLQKGSRARGWLQQIGVNLELWVWEEGVWAGGVGRSR